MTRKGELYAAVHEGFMQARIALARMPELSGTSLGNRVDVLLSDAMKNTGQAMLAAYEKPLRKRRSAK